MNRSSRPKLFGLIGLLLATTVGVFAARGEEEVAPGSDLPSAADVTSRSHALSSFVVMFCADCHGGAEPTADLPLDRHTTSLDLEEDYEIWQTVLYMLEEREMPPENKPQPSDAERAAMIRVIEEMIAEVECGGDPRPGRVTIRRLNRAEYNNTIRDLVGVDFRPADDFPADDVGNGFDNMGDVLSLSPVLLEKYLAAAEQIVTEAFADESLRHTILTSPLEGSRSGNSPGLQENLQSFALRAFRRPVSHEEVDRFMELVRVVQQSGGTDEEAFQAALQAILISPHFLFRAEADPDAGDEDGVRELDDFELASRLSYFLWSSMPDAELFELAERGALRAPETLTAQVQRMLRDEKSHALIENFAGQWLQLRDLQDLSPDPEKFPQFDDELRAAMLRETEMFFASVIHEDRSVLDFLSGDFTFVNGRLAAFYGLDANGIDDGEFRRVALTNNRRGVLTQASILLITSNPTRTSPVKRGKWILENILDDPPPPPPAGVPELAEDAETIGTLREQMEQHRADPTCASCHQRMDPIGFGLENFDAIGGWRDQVNEHAIDASGTLPSGDKFTGPKELMDLLADEKREDFCRCLTKKMLSYALGRGLESYDRCAVDAIEAQLREQEYRFSALVTGIVLSEPFRMREFKGEN